ncbi:MAG: cytochrome D1 domain-containing protein, partial [Pseudomonadota bacterium]
MAVLLLGASQAAAQPYAYVPEYTSNSVSVIDDATQTVVDNIPVGSQPWGVSVSPDSSLAYITNYGAGTISVIDTGTNTVIATEATGGNPYGVAFSPDGSLAYVTSFNTSTLQTFDTATHTLVDTLPLANNPYGLAFTPDGSKLYVSNYTGSAVSVIDTATLTVSATIPAGNGPLHVAMSPDGATVVVANGSSNNLLIVDTATDTTITTIPVGFRATGVAVSNDGTMAVVTSDSSNDIAIVDLGTATLTTTIPMGTPTWGVDFTPDGSQFYVTMLNGSVRIFDTGTLVVSATVPLTGTPYAHGNFFAHGMALPPPIAQGVMLDAVPGAPVVYAEEIIASPGSPVTLLNPAGDLNLSANLGYSFSIGEVRYARFECDNGLEFDAGSTAVYDGAGSAGLGAINGLGNSAMHFSITANDNNVTASDRLVITGDRQITGTTDVNCTYSLYDFPSQAAAGGPAGRVYSVSGPYIRFAPSYALEVDAEGNPIANVESNDPAYSEFTNASPTFDVTLGRIGAFTYGEVQDVTGAVQPLTPAGPAITLADLMDADTALIFAGDFSAASDVFFSPNADCSVNIQSADDFSGIEA